MTDARVPLRPSAEALVNRCAPELLVKEFPEVEEDEAHSIPLWLDVLVQAFQGAIHVPFSFEEMLEIVAGSEERQQTLAMMSRLGVVSASDVLETLSDWSESK